MATFHTRESIVQYLDKIIEEADRELVLISPYIKLDETIKVLLENKKRGIDIDVICRENKLKPNEFSFLNQLRIRIHYLKNLHAKCYLNEYEALLTSMNLYEHSLENNVEMGILISKENDKDLYRAIHRQVLRWKSAANDDKSIKDGAVTSASRKSRTRAEPGPVKKPKEGFCIRCKSGLPANPEQPYCKSCYRSWSRFNAKDETHEERFCHICGKKHEATLPKPLCLTCYRKHKDHFTFAVS